MNINLTLIGQMIAFAAFVWFTMQYIWPPIVKALEERRSRIADGLEAAERGRRELELAQERATQILHEARQEAADILGKAQRRAAEMVDEAKEEARREGERLVEAARAQIQQEIAQAREELRRQVATLAVEGAARILRREVDAKAHQALLDELAGQL
ncbi:F0F1 ATP synthase subunit B [Inmirania thermothiophila]|uniref:ATP synthase subunit b n=1 Tax=Inmirania thermothiophila TaxID=1750597 RepID=A0A3N1Y6A2_9GAMM|nr:F0F1 ATP synthase subunit B [Inmirania thermothiophila]ROR34333.1 F-type H+-transporting ATPase subunit b [Inmirania thermothiophila]